MRLSERRTVHWDFHYAKAMLFSARRLWYYITLSLHHFQRLRFLLIKLNGMLRTFIACFWTCLTLLLWSHTHSHTHLFGFSNLAVSCGCPALSIWVFVVIYASHLSDASSPWVISPPSVSPFQLFSPSQLASRQCQHHLLGMMLAETMGCMVMPHCRPPGWAEVTPLSLLISQDLVAFLTCSSCPESPCCAGVGECTQAWLPSLSAFPQDGCRAALSYASQQDSSLQHPPYRAAFHLLSSPKGTRWAGCLRQVVGCPLKAHVAISCRIVGVSLTAGPRWDLASGGSTQVFPVWSAPRELSVIKHCQ